MQELSPAVNTRAILREQRRLLPCHHSVSAADSCLSHRDKLLTLEKLTEMRIEFMVMTMAFQGLLNMLSPSENFKFLFFFYHKGFPGDSDFKESTCNSGDPYSIPGLGWFIWRRKWQPIPVFLPGEFHGQRRLVGYSPQGGKESDTIERLPLFC